MRTYFWFKFDKCVYKFVCPSFLSCVNSYMYSMYEIYRCAVSVKILKYPRCIGLEINPLAANDASKGIRHCTDSVL